MLNNVVKTIIVMSSTTINKDFTGLLYNNKDVF